MRDILLPFDGSTESRFAAEICWEIASRTESDVTAQHVVDTLAAWNFLSFSLAGFTGSGPYFAASEEICTSLKKLGHTLIDVYESHQCSKNFKGISVIDEGEVFSEVRNRALNHDLLVIGHSNLSSSSKQNFRKSLCQSLAKVLPCPMLIVTEPCSLWKKSRIIVGNQRIKASSIEEILSFCRSLKIESEIFSVKDKKEDWEDFIMKLTNTITPLDSTVPTYKFVENNVMQVPSDTLLVMPALRTANGYMTSYSCDIEKLIQNLELPAILVWPVEKVETQNPVNNQSGMLYENRFQTQLFTD